MTDYGEKTMVSDGLILVKVKHVIQVLFVRKRAKKEKKNKNKTKKSISLWLLSSKTGQLQNFVN